MTYNYNDNKLNQNNNVITYHTGFSAVKNIFKGFGAGFKGKGKHPFISNALLLATLLIPGLNVIGIAFLAFRTFRGVKQAIKVTIDNHHNKPVCVDDANINLNKAKNIDINNYKNIQEQAQLQLRNQKYLPLACTTDNCVNNNFKIYCLDENGNQHFMEVSKKVNGEWKFEESKPNFVEQQFMEHHKPEFIQGEGYVIPDLNQNSSMQMKEFYYNTASGELNNFIKDKNTVPSIDNSTQLNQSVYDELVQSQNNKFEIVKDTQNEVPPMQTQESAQGR